MILYDVLPCCVAGGKQSTIVRCRVVYLHFVWTLAIRQSKFCVIVFTRNCTAKVHVQYLVPHPARGTVQEQYIHIHHGRLLRRLRRINTSA